MSPTGGIRFGVQILPQHTTWSELREAWRVADDCGFDTAWTFDHFYPITGDPTGPCLEGWTALAALMAGVRRIEGGVLVTGNTYRHPAVVANMAATLDHVSDGRLILGLGAAWFEMEHAAYGIPFPPVGERIARLDEACTIISSLLTRTETTFLGRYYTVRNAWCEPKPVRRPRPPIMIGGGGERKTLRVVAKHADQWNWFGTVDSFRHKLRVLAEHCRAVGRDPATIEPSWGGEFRVTDGSAEKRATLEAMSRRRNQSPDGVEAECLVGSPEEIADRIRAYQSAGVRHFLLSISAPFDLEGLRQFSEKVIPLFR